MTTEDLIQRAAILLSFREIDEHAAARVLMTTGELSPEEVFLAVKAAVILNREEKSE